MNSLRALEALRETGSVSAAAARLSVSHSAVSHQIRILEQWVDRPITIKRGRSVALTEAGESLARVVRESFDYIRHELDLLPMRFQRSVSVSALPIIAEEIILPEISAFHERHPEITLHVSLAQTDRARTPAPDIEILFRDKSSLQPGEQAYLPGNAVPVAAPRLIKKAGGDHLNVLRQGPLLSDEDSRMWPRWQSVAGDLLGLDTQPPQIFLEGSFLLQKAAMDGLGVALCRVATLRKAVEDGRLVILSDRQIDENWTYTLRMPSPRASEAEVQLVASWLNGLTNGSVDIDKIPANGSVSRQNASRKVKSNSPI
ncbi:MAG: LysR family transcriptional regulator [Pseudomonadota bacterium]